VIFVAVDEFEFILRKSVDETQCDAVAIGLFEENLQRNELESANALSEEKLSKLVEKKEFAAKEGEVLTFYTSGKQQKFFAIGLGKESAFSTENARKLGAIVSKAARKAKVKKLAFSMLDLKLNLISFEDFTRSFCEGALLSQYKYSKYKAQKPEEEDAKLSQIALIFESPEKIERSAFKGKILAQMQNAARDLDNSPGNDLTPIKFSEIANELSKKYNLNMTVFEKAEIERMGMNGLIAVNKGSDLPPKLLVLRYFGKDISPASTALALVGKGVTFDAGGISLKPSDGMERMKGDKAGAVAVLMALCAASALKLKINVIGVLPITENMPDGKATRPGDIVTMYNKKTVEIQNTDAEGRLILADALAYTQTLKPSAIIDIATLTGACSVALGAEAIAIMANNSELVQTFREAGLDSFERVWELPMWKEYDDYIKSDVADMKNIGRKGQAGTIAGAVFLRHFVGDFPWVHLDIASVDWSDDDRYYKTKGSDGAGVRLLTYFLEKMESKQ